MGGVFVTVFARISGRKKESNVLYLNFFLATASRTLSISFEVSFWSVLVSAGSIFGS